MKTLNLKNRIARAVVSITAILAMGVTFTSCKKSTGSQNPQPGGSDLLYPTTVSFYEGNNSAYPEVREFKYDGDHLLTFMGTKYRYAKINASSVDKIYIDRDTLVISNIFDGNIYTGKNVNNVSSTSRWRYSGSLPPYNGPENKYNLPPTDPSYTKILHFNMGKASHFFSYDDNGNLTSSKFVTNSWGSPNSSQFDPGGLEYARLTYKGYDDKLSPYSSIAGYRFIAFQWAYPQEFSFAMSKHNPTQIIEESLDTNTRTFKVTSQVDFTYTYNDQGYPTQVKIKTVYPNSSTPSDAFYQTYNITSSN
ncbi:MAG: hypothetical protein ABW174_11145 [Flavitalea sp.]